METCAYHLYFNTPLHVGVEAIGQEQIEIEIGSDTLWGAIVQCWALLWDEDIGELATQKAFSISSAFPCHKDQRYYPVPVNFLDFLQSDENEDNYKALKKIRYLREDLLMNLCAGQGLAGGKLKLVGSHYPDIYEDEDKRQHFEFWKISQRPRIRIDRQTGGSEEGGFFYCSDLSFLPDRGLFFLARMTAAVRAKFEAALGLLADQGLGADRSIGRGRFRFVRHDVPDQIDNEKSQAQLLLSICSPSPADINSGALQQSQVRLKMRRGHASAPAVGSLRRPDLLTLAEGSILSPSIKGQIVPVIRRGGVAPHDVYRNGIAFTLSISLKGVSTS